MAGEVHADRVGGEEGEVELAETVRARSTTERRPSGGVGRWIWGKGGLDDAGRLAGGVEGGLGREGEEKNGDLVVEKAWFRRRRWRSLHWRKTWSSRLQTSKRFLLIIKLLCFDNNLK